MRERQCKARRSKKKSELDKQTVAMKKEKEAEKRRKTELYSHKLNTRRCNKENLPGTSAHFLVGCGMMPSSDQQNECSVCLGR